MILYPPHPFLHHMVAHFGIGHADGAVGAEGVEFEYYPDGHADLLIQLEDGGCRLLIFGPARTRAALRIPVRAGGRDLLVRFRPGRFPRHGEVDPASLVDGVAPLDTLFGRSADQWAGVLGSAADPDHCQRLLADILLAAEARAPSPPANGRAFIDRITASHGRASIGAFARQYGISPRQLQRHTRELVGLPPKTLARHLRLQWILQALFSGNPPPHRFGL